MGTSSSAFGHQQPEYGFACAPESNLNELESAGFLTAALPNKIADDEITTASKKKSINGDNAKENVDESLKSLTSNKSDQSESITEEDEEMNVKESRTSEELSAMREKSFQCLGDISERLSKVNVKTDSVESLWIKVADDLRYIYRLYGELNGKVTRQQLESFRKDVALKLIDSDILKFMVTVVKDFPVDLDFCDASDREHAVGSIVNIILMTMFNYTDASEKLSVAVVNMGVLETCKEILDMHSEGHLENKLHGILEEYIHSIHGIIHNVSMTDANVGKLQRMGFTKVLHPYLKSPNDEIPMVTLTTLANIVKEEECDVIAANVLLVARLLSNLERGLDSQNHRYAGWSCKECGLAVRNLAKNDANKKLLWNLNVLRILVKLGKTGDIEEQTESVHAIWALAFDEEVRKDIANNAEIGVVDLLLELKESSTIDSLKNAINKCLWTLKDELKASKIKAHRDAVEVVQTKTQPSNQEGHIMISYQRENREMLRKVKEHLTDNKYKVWMDIDQMGGSTLQAMAEAVEHADVVLLCYSRRYKESDNCRLEAEYAHEQRKTIIPLKMEQDYRPDGWLGLMIGSKYFVEFSGKYQFEVKLKDLDRELTRVYEGKPVETFKETPFVRQATLPVIEHPRDEVDATPKERRKESNADVISTIATVRHWSKDDVSNWLTKNNLKSDELDGLTGEEISFLARTLHEAPEQLHRYLRKDLKIKSLLLKSKFVWALQDIINNRI